MTPDELAALIRSAEAALPLLMSAWQSHLRSRANRDAELRALHAFAVDMDMTSRKLREAAERGGLELDRRSPDFRWFFDQRGPRRNWPRARAALGVAADPTSISTVEGFLATITSRGLEPEACLAAAEYCERLRDGVKDILYGVGGHGKAL
ncbi:MAG: hypothetical protein QJR14_09575 [Bacillota bacterium]|nr:hypothetical protein [Bacillota bacterium]